MYIKHFRREGARNARRSGTPTPGGRTFWSSANAVTFDRQGGVVLKRAAEDDDATVHVRALRRRRKIENSFESRARSGDFDPVENLRSVHATPSSAPPRMTAICAFSVPMAAGVGNLDDVDDDRADWELLRASSNGNSR